MTTYYDSIHSLYGTPTPVDFHTSGSGRAAVLVFNTSGRGRHPIVVMRYDSMAPGFDATTNGVIDGWSHASASKIQGLDPEDFDLVVFSLRPGKPAASGVDAYEVAELAVAQRILGTREVLAAVHRKTSHAALANMIHDVSKLPL